MVAVEWKYALWTPAQLADHLPRSCACSPQQALGVWLAVVWVEPDTLMSTIDGVRCSSRAPVHVVSSEIDR